MGGVNHLKAFIYLIDLAYKIDNYDYYHLVTGQDAFIGTEQELNSFISTYPKNISFIESYPIPAKQYTLWESGWGIFDYYFFSDCLNYNLKTIQGNRLFKLTKKITQILHLRRKRPDYPVYIGSVYCSLSNYAVECIEKSSLKKKLLKRLNYTLCGEGVYFNTILKYEDCPICNQTLTYTDWTSTSEKPKVLEECDYGLWGKEKFFIRKLDSKKSHGLLEKLDL